MTKYLCICLILFACFPRSVHAAGADTAAAPEDLGSLDSIESELEKEIPMADVKPDRAPVPAKVLPTIDYSSVKDSTPYSDVVIVQKTFMPKTGRTQLFGGLAWGMNDVFYRDIGGQLRAAYHFSETWGAELTGMFLSSSSGSELKDLQNRNVGIQNLVSVKSYLGANVYFDSIYGKAAFGRTIIPFEIYQTAGVGQVQTASGSATAAMVGIGDIFSKSRNSAWRLDLSLLLFNSKDIQGNQQFSNLLVLGFGWGALVPGVGVR